MFVEAAGEVVFEAAYGFVGCLSFGGAALRVGAGFGVVLGVAEGDRVDGVVGLAVAAAGEPVALCLAG